MSTEFCSVHNQPWRTIPAGVSKSTNKPYQSFQACPERGCREKPGNPPFRTATTSVSDSSTGILIEIRDLLKQLVNKNGNVELPIDSIPF